MSMAKFKMSDEERYVPRKKFKNGLLDFAHRRPLLAFFVVPIAIDIVAKVFQGGIRTAKYGDYKLGSIASTDDSSLFGETDGFDLFGTLTNKNATIGVPDPNSGILKGEFYRDTSHLTPVSRIGADAGADMYKDTRHMMRSNYKPYTPSESGFIGRSTGSKLSDGAISGDKKPDQNLVDLVGTGLFAGLSGARRLC